MWTHFLALQLSHALLTTVTAQDTNDATKSTYPNFWDSNVNEDLVQATEVEDNKVQPINDTEKYSNSKSVDSSLDEKSFLARSDDHEKNSSDSEHNGSLSEHDNNENSISNNVFIDKEDKNDLLEQVVHNNSQERAKVYDTIFENSDSDAATKAYEDEKSAIRDEDEKIESEIERVSYSLVLLILYDS